MKKASKVFIIISIALSVAYAIDGLVLLSTSQKFDVGFLIIIVCAIIQVVGFTTLKALDRAKKPKDLVTAGVMTMIFCSFLGGLFVLLITEEELNAQKTYISTTTSAQISNNNATQFSTATSNIQKTQLVKKVEEKHCPSCGAKLEEDQKFCGVCGKSTFNICSECNTKNKPDDNFCRNCGNKLTK